MHIKKQQVSKVKYVYVLQFVHQKTTNQIERQNLVT